MAKTEKRTRRNNVIPFLLRSPASAVHREQRVCGDLLPFARKRGLDGRPMTVRNPTSLTPLAGSPRADADVTGHLRDGLPAFEQGTEGFHNALIAGDGLSRQVVPIVPVTKKEAHRTITAMGRAKTPIQFNKDLAMRLKAARIAAGYDTQGPFAKALGIELERYKKWESGRTPIQHEFLPRACELTGKDANYFYGVQPVEQVFIRRTGTQ